MLVYIFEKTRKVFNNLYFYRDLIRWEKKLFNEMVAHYLRYVNRDPDLGSTVSSHEI